MLRRLSLLLLTSGMLIASCANGDVDFAGSSQGRPDADLSRDDAASNSGTTEYRFVEYEVLLSTLVDILGVGPNGSAIDNPRDNPIGFLEARKGSVGAAEYDTETVGEVKVPGGFSTLGIKTWILASTSACGRAMAARRAEFFPDGVDNANFLYLTLLGRLPVAEEGAVLADLRTALSGTSGWSAYSAEMQENKYASAVCGAILGSTEFLTVN